MPEYAISFTRAARKELEALSAPLVRRIYPRIESLAFNPRPAGCRKLKGSPDLWRIRVGDYRVIYRILEKIVHVEIITVRSRGDAYQ